MWRGREDQYVNTTKPRWWLPHAVTRREILNVSFLILLVETDPVGRQKEWMEGEEGKQSQKMKTGVVGGGHGEDRAHLERLPPAPGPSMFRSWAWR